MNFLQKTFKNLIFENDADSIVKRISMEPIHKVDVDKAMLEVTWDDLNLNQKRFEDVIW